MKKCFIGLGSNERTAARLLAAQSDLCRSFPGIVFSRLVWTAPVGFDSPRMFYNQVACFTTPLTVSQVRERLKKIERDHGRTPDDKARGIVTCCVTTEKSSNRRTGSEAMSARGWRNWPLPEGRNADTYFKS